MKKYILIVIALFIPFFITSCGEGVVELSDAKYEPKIVMDAYIFAGKPVKDIRITRNFPLNQNIDVTKIILYNADVKLTDVQTGQVYQLTFDVNSLAFKYNGNDLIIASGKTYRLEVTADVDGRKLNASSVTTVPLPGLVALQKDLGVIKYREKDSNGEVKKINFNFTPSKDCGFYAISVEALDAELNTFIYDNAYFEVDSEDVKKDFDYYKLQSEWMQGINSNMPELNAEVHWLSTWFYGKYEVIIYAGDRNFHHFFVTHKNVQEPDGNFHEPAMYIDGDGIGVFGSAVSDTVRFEIVK